MQNITIEPEESCSLNNPEAAKISEAIPRVYTIVDLFAGCGGLSLGFENSGFTSVFVNELNDDALSTYLLNRHHYLGGLKFSDNPSLRCNDAHELDAKRLVQLKSDLSVIPEIDLKFEKPQNSQNGGGSTLDVIAGGPPCQGFSGIGHRRSYAVDKEMLPSNHLYQRMASIIRDLRPRIFLFENVRGLLNAKWTKDGGEPIWPDVLKEFRNIAGYEVRWRLVYAKDYGVPQNRPRVLMVGIRKDIVNGNPMLDPKADPDDAIKCGFLPQSGEQTPPDMVDLLDDLVDPAILEVLLSGNYPLGRFANDQYPSKPKTRIQKMMRRTPHFMKKNASVELTEQEYSKHAPLIVEKFAHMLANEGHIPEFFKTKKFAQRVLPARWDAQGPTITATSMPDDNVHYSQPRVLTVREWARLQLFPDWYQFAGKRTTGGIRRAGNPLAGLFEREVPKYTQIGNAVPVGLAESVGKHFIKILNSYLG
ncbi:MAG: DNA cytosine methyltransferase [Chlorobiaceae bacterium]|nr:DNA cytosine methyltransferase [Chlorobiaceae bacterium]